jgi:hypothetical protein
MTRWLRLLPLALLCICATAHADVVYKCVGAGGKVTYSQNPCYGEDWHRFGAPSSAESPAEPRQKPANTKPASDTERTNAKPAPKKPTPAS